MLPEHHDEIDTNTLLLTLDQVHQTIQVMSNVVDKLRNYLTPSTETPPTASCLQLELEFLGPIEQRQNLLPEPPLLGAKRITKNESVIH
ncbi:hypothetical protein EDC56_3863 [Sinobacterium caligoides]|uniref:Uncharacterized protein n=1 Tax=Sinobacterium caligoides TaxID=933926 RepID=A0A3N2D520_9GAMM|nr:hypothetical protein [Sinobacterium caligoides]ROR94877.1 hypothetical protein EDC56_3863 [Sinobacterium caligoides]